VLRFLSVFARFNKKLDTLLRWVVSAKKDQEKIMSKLDDLASQVAATETVMGSAVALIQGFSGELADLRAELAAAGVSTATVDNLRADLAAKTATLAAAVAANTVQAPAPAPSPEPVSTPAEPGAGSEASTS
jgi:peptidoglycan hydrolase CwlO-like protein